MYFVFTEPHTVQDRKFGAIIYYVVQRLETFVWKCFDANCIGKFGPNLDFFLGTVIRFKELPWYQHFVIPSSLKHVYSLIMHVKVCFAIAGTPITYVYV